MKKALIAQKEQYGSITEAIRKQEDMFQTAQMCPRRKAGKNI